MTVALLLLAVADIAFSFVCSNGLIVTPNVLQTGARRCCARPSPPWAWASLGSPLLLAQAVEAVQAQRMPFRDARMFELLVSIVHTDAFHDSTGSPVADRGERDDLGEAQPFKADAQCTPGCLGSEAVSPMHAGKAPANFDAG